MKIFPTHSLLPRRRCVKRHKAAKKKENVGCIYMTQYFNKKRRGEEGAGFFMGSAHAFFFCLYDVFSLHCNGQSLALSSLLLIFKSSNSRRFSKWLLVAAIVETLCLFCVVFTACLCLATESHPAYSEPHLPHSYCDSCTLVLWCLGKKWF